MGEPHSPDGNERAAGHTFAFAAFRLTIGLRTDDPALLEHLPHYLPHGWRPAPHADLDREYVVLRAATGEQGASYSICCDGVLSTFRGALEETLDALERDFRLFMVDHARDWVFVHAGVVGWKGRAIVIPARSRAGKSSLTLELVRAGAEYYSDEYAVIDARGRVQPYATPLQIRTRPGSRQARYTPADVGGQAGTEPIPVGLVAAVTFEPGSSDRLEELTPGQGVLALLEHAPAGARAEWTLATLEHAVAGARIIAGVRGEARHFARRLLTLLDADVPIAQ